MMMLVSYDVAKDEKGEKRLRHVAKILENYGQRVQYSVFECLVEPAQWVELKSKLLKEINPDYDSLRFYSLGANWQRKVEHVGQKAVLNLQDDVLIIQLDFSGKLFDMSIIFLRSYGKHRKNNIA